jgi:acetate kinase
MTILVVNAGSSSVKFTLFGPMASERLATGIVERIGTGRPRIQYRNFRKESLDRRVGVTDADQAVAALLEVLTENDVGVLESVDAIAVVGHRVVHGGEHLTQPIRVDDEVKRIIDECAHMAPLHNPPNLKGIGACEKRIPHAHQVAVFDTAFHATIPEHAFLYGLPYGMYREHGIRRYGFHGISHDYVSQEAARFLKQPRDKLRIITCHLGNGCSVAALLDGHCIDTSMGFTPLEGLIMGTRCGDLDPAVVLHMLERLGMTIGEVREILNKESGLLGLAEVGSNDLRDIFKAEQDGDQRAAVAVRTFCYRITKYIGAYRAALGGLDVLVFTAGIGENSPEVRRRACEPMDSQGGSGIILDPEKNRSSLSEIREISSSESSVRVLVVPTDEEQEIARQSRNQVRRFNHDRSQKHTGRQGRPGLL